MNEATPQARASLADFAPRVLYTAFYVRDLDRATAFYIDLLGLEQRLRFQLPDGVWECVLEYPSGKGSGVILMWDPERDTARELGDGYSRLVFKVSDLDAAMEIVRRHEARVTIPPTDAPLQGLRFAMFLDPDGYTIELMQLPKR